MKTIDDTARDLGCVAPQEEEFLERQRQERERELQLPAQTQTQTQTLEQQPQHTPSDPASITSTTTTTSTSTSTSSSSGILPPPEKITEVASSSMQEVRTMLNAAYESELVGKAMQRVREYVPGLAGGAGEGDGEEDRSAADPEEMRRIDALEKERIAEFLQERTRTKTDLEKKYHHKEQPPPRQ
ncbi:hypothetical protein ASPACDRAFT_1852775 [Aspergillus aculeatus ATCC 16872]|uniref:Uncharacterized protein n=1 Tax=Aspergillus aculeatus (strain ATCC 16872 / CBS 172.66 / WB 5094) TaxID=690307 RepID=A0A1L9X6A1_ASPA1|nr:uncharacterized protein ASPACDRAFT_1852775 [Aspergillus aculeatus ATCC 16872]OJK03849.1 hypothetical protein ASPACDRAFT_1852775 [Aspergillus aculeatus ATCC 16872]